jgi:hypothetical protein
MCLNCMPVSDSTEAEATDRMVRMVPPQAIFSSLSTRTIPIFLFPWNMMSEVALGARVDNMANLAMAELEVEAEHHMPGKCECR